MMVKISPINCLQHHNKHSSDNVTLLLLGMTRTDRRDGMDSVVVLPTTAWLDLSEAGGTAQ